MSEGNRLSYRIEFEADEESLVDAIGDAIISSKPAIDTMLQEVIITAFNNSVAEAMKSIGPIKMNIDIPQRESISRAREVSSPVPQQDERTVSEMLEKTTEVMDRTDIDIKPVVLSAMSVLVSQIMEFISSSSPAHGRMLLRSTVSDVGRQVSRFGDLSTVISTLTSLTEKAERHEGISHLSDSMRDTMLAIMGRERGMDIVKEEIRPETGDVQKMSVRDLMGVMGVTPDYEDEDVREILRTEIAVALREGGVTVGLYEPVVTPDEMSKFDDVIEYLKESIGDIGTGIVGRVKSILGVGEKERELEFRKFGGVVDERHDVEKISDASRESEFHVSDLPPPTTTALNFDRLVEALNNLITTLYSIGEPESAGHARAALDGLLEQAERHSKSGDGD